MADEDDYEGGGSGFMMGLLTGTVLGAGLGMLFAPKRGSELRGQLSESASQIGRAASDQYQKAAGAAGEIAERGREIAGRGREIAERGREMGRDMIGRAREVVTRGSVPSSETTGENYPSGQTRG